MIDHLTIRIRFFSPTLELNLRLPNQVVRVCISPVRFKPKAFEFPDQPRDIAMLPLGICAPNYGRLLAVHPLAIRAVNSTCHCRCLCVSSCIAL